MTERITQGMLATNLLADLQNITDQMSTSQEQLSSGKQILKPSDDPFGTARALAFRDDLASNQQYQTNINNATGWMNATDSALQSIEQLTQRARELVVQGATDTTGADGRTAIAQEIDQIIDSIKTTANTQYAGRYIFAGSMTTTAPYTTGGADSYNGDTATLNTEIGAGVQVPMNVTGASVVGDGSTPGSLLATLRTIENDLNSGNTSALQTTDLQALDTANDAVTNAQATVGARSDRLSTALTRLQSIQESTTSLLSDTEDADVSQVMVNLSQEQTVYQAALKAGADIVQPSLMDFLQ
ncbi:MAG TPA: flagellar hook-associated protein FlgL [Gaiellaceae bacterium]|nr:flagellar hook-associated protein FlgL [Gaiellaceae bacterium]